MPKAQPPDFFDRSNGNQAGGRPSPVPRPERPESSGAARGQTQGDATDADGVGEASAGDRLVSAPTPRPDLPQPMSSAGPAAVGRTADPSAPLYATSPHATVAAAGAPVVAAESVSASLIPDATLSLPDAPADAAAPDPVPASPKSRRRGDPAAGEVAFAGPPWLGARIRRGQIDLHWLFVAALLLASGMPFFGWRAAAQAGVAALVAMMSFFLVSWLIRLLLHRPPRDARRHALATAVLLCVCLPAGVGLSFSVLAGAALGVAIHVVGRSHRVRVHPVALAMIVAWLFPCIWVAPDWSAIDWRSHITPVPAVLRPDRVVTGDLHDLRPTIHDGPWWAPARVSESKHDAIRRPHPATLLQRETPKILAHDWFLARMLTSGELCRLEEILLGCVPGPIGGASQGLIMLLGLYLMFRRLSYWPMAAAALAAALAAFVLLPAPGQAGLTPLAARLTQLPVATLVTFMAYVLLASPLSLLALILAPATAPMSASGRVIYGMILGAALMVAQRWSIPLAEFLALALAGAMSRPLDALDGQGLGG